MSDTKVTATLSAKDKMSSVFDKAANRAGAFGGSLKSALGSGVAMGVGMKLFDSAITAVTTHMDSAISRFDTLNNFPKVMNNLGISAKDSEESINLMQKRLKGLPTTLDSAAAGVQRLTSKNGNVKKSTKYFLAMNDAIVAGGASTEIQQSAIEQLSQAYSKGRMDMMEWRTLQMAMPGQLNQVAKAMNMTADELGEGLRNGSVSMDDFMNTISKLDKEGVDGFKSFKDQALDATGGIGTAVTNLHTAITSGITTAMQEIDKALKKNNLPTIGESINMVGNQIGKFGKKVANLVPKLAEGAAYVRDHKEQFKLLGGVMLGCVVAFNLLKAGLAISGAITTVGNAMAIMAGKAAATVPALGAEAAASTAAGSASKISAKGFMQAGLGLMMVGAGVALAGVGMLLMATAATKLAAAGWPAIAVMGGMVVSLAAVAAAAAVFAPVLVTAGGALTIFGLGLAMVGGGVMAVGGGIKMMGNGIKNVAKFGKQAAASMKALVVPMLKAGVAAKTASKKLGDGFAEGMKTGLNKAKTNVTASLKQALTAAKSKKSAFRNAGKMMAEGLANGIKAGKGKVSAAAESLAKSAHKTVVVTAKIGSPSRTFKKLGGYIGKGFAIGIESTKKMVRNASESLVSLPSVSAPNYAMALSDGVDYGGGFNGVIEVPLYLNGREFAKATSGDMENELNNRTRMSNRKQGRI